MKKIIKEIIPYIIILVVVVTIRTFIITPVSVSGNSMKETLQNKDIMILNKLSNINRYDIVVAKFRNDKIIKRVMAMPGDKIKCVSGIIYINNEEDKSGYGYGNTDDFKEYILSDDEYFLMGDNREDSFDSRYFGPLKKNDILGTTNLIIFPFKHFGTVK